MCDASNLDSPCCPFAVSFSSLTPIYCCLLCNLNLWECHTIICRNPNEHCKNTVLWDVQKQKGFQLLGAAPRPPDQGLWPLWGQSPQTPIIGSRSRARHILVPPKICPGPPLPRVLAPALFTWYIKWEAMAVCFRLKVNSQWVQTTGGHTKIKQILATSVPLSQKWIDHVYQSLSY